MKRLQSLNVDIEAIPDVDLVVPAEVVENDLQSIRGRDWEDAQGAVDAADPLLQSFEQWLGRDAVSRLNLGDFQVLKRAVGMLPDPVAADSFVWDAIKGPSDILRVSEAVMAYRQFDRSALVLAEAMGANTDIRGVLKSTTCGAGNLVRDFVITERLTVDRIAAFNDRLDALVPFMKNMFGDREFTVGAAVTAIAAAKGLERGFSKMEVGFELSRPASEEVLGQLEFFREEMVRGSELVRKACKVAPLRFSLGTLSGVRRSLADDGAGDFRYAVRALGGSLETEEDFLAAVTAFREFLRNVDDFNRVVVDAGFGLDESSRLLSHVMARRHMKSSSEAAGVPWGNVAAELSIRPDVTLEALRAMVAGVGEDAGLTGRLKSVSRDYAKKLSSVMEVARHHVVSNRYWMDAADRVVEVDPEVSIEDLRDIIRLEPQIARAKEELKACGAGSGEDIDELEAHLEWMISAYALPVREDAFDAIISSRAEIIPLSLSRAS
jgi:hypothetical protein